MAYKHTRESVYKLIDGERAYQEEMWDNMDVHANELSVGDFILLVEEYAARARKEWSGHKYPEQPALEHMRKIAGIAVRCMETHGAPPRA
jgi:hypothetical protein